MKRLTLGGIYEYVLLAVLLLIVIHAPLSVWIGTIFPELWVVVKAWKEIVLAILIVAAIGMITRRKLWHRLLKSKLVLLCLVFVDIHLLMALLFFSDAASVVAGLMIDLRFIAVFLLTHVLIVVRPAALSNVIKVVAAGAVIVLGFGLLQITVLPDDILARIGYSTQTITPFTTIDSNTDYVRINSTLRGPNPLGALAVVYITLAVAYLVRRRGSIDARRKTQALAASVAGVAILFASYSRSAYLACIAAIVVVVAVLGRPSKKIMLSGAAITVVLVGSLVALSSTDWFSNVVLHEDPESTVVTKSNAGHVESLEEGFSRMVRQPFGAGVGSTGSASLYDADTKNDIVIENYYFFVAHEVGWIGLLTFLAIFGLTLYGLFKRRSDWLALGVFASGIGLGLIGILLPVWTDETVAFIWWGLAGAVLGTPRGIMGGKHGRSTRKQKTARTS